MTRFTLPGLAEITTRSKLNVQKTRLAKLDLNSLSSSALLSQSSTTIAFGILTLWTLLNMLDMVHMVESEEYMERLHSADWEVLENVQL